MSELTVFILLNQLNVLGVHMDPLRTVLISATENPGTEPHRRVCGWRLRSDGYLPRCVRGLTERVCSGQSSTSPAVDDFMLDVTRVAGY